MSFKYTKACFLYKKKYYKLYEYFVCRITQFFSDTLRPTEEIFKEYFNIFTLHEMKWNWDTLFRCTKAWFIYTVAQENSHILWAKLENGWKCIFNCVSWFVSAIQNFNALCDAYTVYRHDVGYSTEIEYFASY